MKKLFAAVRAGDLSKVQALVDANPSLAIFAAAILGQTDQLEKMIGNDRSLVSAVSEDGWTPLHLAAFFGREDAARLLLNKGAQPSARSTNAMANTALHAAAQSGDVPIARALLDNGADASARAGNQQRPIDLALTGGHQAMVELLEARGASL